MKDDRKFFTRILYENESNSLPLNLGGFSDLFDQ